MNDPFPAPIPRPGKVYYFGTCVIDACFPQAGLAGVELLQREGVQVIFPQAQSCCGQPAHNSGFPDEARRVARHQLKAFARDYPIVVPSGSCAGMLKHQYPHLFAHEPDIEEVQRFSSRIYELSEFMVKVLQVRLEDRGEPIKVTWHSSCHALREMAIIPYAKTLLGQLKQVELVELQNERECCGFGGTFSVKQPAISAAMADDKVNDIVQTGAARVLSTDCGCLLNISGTLGYRQLSIPTQHLAEFILERTQ
ncbi:MAG: (Fe-S)-binding protein [Candidatus Competibacteraceae bacterium]|nr:(Fe-S)-binding protein [Candidatus Competibacteraceae bacterium]MCB1821548.1 (Fe-S)-binding protein [Candidatus Competibacteraceae bacterium]HRY16224.1 (Fe-S)-binding protein [Candidatus Competibacteraceae bacterium]